MEAARKAAEVAEEWTTVEDAGRQLGKSRLAVLTLCIKGDLVGKHMAGRTLILQSSIDGELERRKQRAAHDQIAAAQ